MRRVTLEGGDWVTEADFYDALLPALRAPEWHGRNLDALNDSIRGDDINALKLPYEVAILGCDRMGEGARSVVSRFEWLVGELQSEGTEITLTCEPRG